MTDTDNVSFDLYAQDINPLTIRFNNLGTKLFMLVGKSNTVFQYSLECAGDLSTITYDNVSFDFYAKDIKFNNLGTKLFMLGGII